MVVGEESHLNLYWEIVDRLKQNGWDDTPIKGTFCRKRGDEPLVMTSAYFPGLEESFRLAVIARGREGTAKIALKVETNFNGQWEEYYRIDYAPRPGWHIHKSNGRKEYFGGKKLTSLEHWKYFVDCVTSYPNTLPTMIDLLSPI